MDHAVLAKMQRYCAYQERAESEVRQKLTSFKLNYEDEQAILKQLITEHYFDNERFTEIYVKSKSAKAWGKNKIRTGLLQKKIPETLIQKYLALLNPDKSREDAAKLAEKWLKTNKKKDNIPVRLYRYLYGRGFDAVDISKALNELNYG